MSIRVNFTDVKDTFDLLPSATYVAKVTDGEMREAGPQAKNPGADMINWEFTVQRGDHEGRKQWYNTVLVEAALGMLKNLLGACSKDGQPLFDDLDGDLDFDIDTVVGSDVKIVVGQRPYEGEMRNYVKRIKALTDEDIAEETLLP
jgi:hypothetical protein